MGDPGEVAAFDAALARVSEGVTGVKVGDHVIVHPGYWDANDPWIKAGKDPMISASARIQFSTSRPRILPFRS